MKSKIIRTTYITFIMFVFFIGVPFAFAYFAKYIVSTPSASVTLPSLGSTSVPMSISLDPAYTYALGGAKYKIERWHECSQYDSKGWDCIDQADLCPYISLEPKDNKNGTETGFPQDASHPYTNATGEINYEEDIDNWDVKISSPCFEGECPTDYDSEKFGTPLPQSLKGKTFACNLEVISKDPPVLVQNILEQSIAFAYGLKNTMVVSAIFTGEYTPPVTGSSNVLFLPGLEASRLYLDESGSENQLWEPNRNLDVEKLYLNTDGTSKNTEIYTRDIIKETNTPISLGMAGQNIYKSFSDMMDDLVVSKKINRWESYAYDWRQNVEDIVNNGTPYFKEKLSLTAVLQTLVETSQNGKVTIVAHSNGGILAKALLVKLQEDKVAGKNNLIDKVDNLILVAVPQIGTAGAVPAILHGYDQNIGLGWLMDETRARELGRNMPSAYGLLPTREYISRVSASPIIFSDNVAPSGVTTGFINAYGNVIDSYSEYKNFLFGAEGRAQPEITDMIKPINLLSSLFSSAETLHNKIDVWTPQNGLRVIEVAGWGLDTVASFEYYPKYECGGTTSGIVFCKNVLDERPIFTVDGDKTVVEPSAIYMNGVDKVWVNFKKNNTLFKINRGHKDILEVSQLNKFISSVIKDEDPVYDLVLSTTKPTDDTNRLRISIHSPVSIGVYDKDGNFTGKICPTDSDFCYKKEDIPNSSYLEFGEGKYVNLPEENMQKVVLQGTDVGTFTYESTRVLPNGQSNTTVFADIPVTDQTKAEITNDTDTQIPRIYLDVTGDGTVDFTISPQEEFNPVLFLQIMKKTIESFDVSKNQKNTLLKRIDDTIKAIQKGKINKAKIKVEQFRKSLAVHSKESDKEKQERERKPKGISSSDRQILISMLNQLLDNLNK